MKIKLLTVTYGCLILSNIVAMDPQKTYNVTNGPYKNEKVELIETKKLSQAIGEKGVNDILLARIANLDEEKKKAVMASINTKKPHEMLQSLPENLKGPVALCQIQHEKKYIDKSFLEN